MVGRAPVAAAVLAWALRVLPRLPPVPRARLVVVSPRRPPMPELDAEHRNRLVAAFSGSTRNPEHLAFLIEPLVAGWIAEERERARFNDEVRREQIRMARADALREAADNIHEVSGHSAGVPVWRSQVADWLNERADRGGDDG